MSSSALKIVTLCGLFVLAAARAKDSDRRWTRRGRGGHDATSSSDSGRSLLPLSERGDSDLGEDGQDDQDGRGLAPGLGPWSARGHLAVQEQFRRFNLPMIACRSRFGSALRKAGSSAEHVADVALREGRAFLDKLVDSALADVDATVTEVDPEIATLQASLDAGQRYPAGDVLEARWRRAVRLSKSPPDESILQLRRLFQDSALPLWLILERALEADGLDAEGAATVARFQKCLQHRLLPRRQ